jgi:3-isopropylmalate/(R)-2-methylmalate dehydratase small subunit
MDPISTIVGTAAPLPRANVDTDQIMPKQFLKRVERTGYGEFVFWDWARLPDGSPDPGFVLNKPEYAGASILLAGPNFGSGSSREHAPWGLQDWGFRAVIAPSFADIFFNNSCNIGLLPVVLAEKEVRYLVELTEADPTAEVSVSLVDLTVTAEGFETRFHLDESTRHRLRNGLDPIGVTLSHADEIAAFEAARLSHKPVLA